MTVARRSLLGLLLLAPACLPATPLEYDTLGEARSALFFADGARGHFVDLAAPPPRLAVGGDIRVVTFPWTLAELEVEPGLVDLGAAPGRPLPPPLAGFRMTEDELAFRADAGVLEAVADLRIPGRDDARCVRRGGCRAPNGVSVCLAPCPAPEAPAPPAPPVIPCPAGWVAEAEPGLGGNDWCRPVLPEADPGCPAGTFAWLDAPHCAPVDDCPAAPFRTDGDALHVLADAPAGGDGSATRPFRRLGQALAVATPGATVALGPGTYAGAPVDTPDVRLLGRCAADTRVRFDPGESHSIRVEADGVSVAHLTIEGRLDVVRSATVTAVAVEGDVVVRPQARLQSSRLRMGPGPEPAVTVQRSGQAVVADASLEGAVVSCGADATLDVSGAWFRTPSSDPVTALGCTQVTLRRILVDGGPRLASIRIEEGTDDVTIEDLAFRDVDANAIHITRGRGPAGRAVLRRIWVEDARRVLQVDGGFDVVLEDVGARRLRTWAVLGQSDEGAPLDIRLARLQVREAFGALRAGRLDRHTGFTAQWHVSDVVSTATGAINSDFAGHLRVLSGARLFGQRLWLTGPQHQGVYVADGTVEVQDVHVAGAIEAGARWGTLGENVVRRMRVLDPPLFGIVVGAGFEGPGSLTVEDFTLSASARPTNIGLVAETETPLRADRFLLEGVTVGVEAGADFSLSRGRISRCGVGLSRVVGPLDLTTLVSGVQMDCTRPFD